VGFEPSSLSHLSVLLSRFCQVEAVPLLPDPRVVLSVEELLPFVWLRFLFPVRVTDEGA